MERQKKSLAFRMVKPGFILFSKREGKG